MTDLHHDVRGSGPVLLVVPGGAGHPMGLGPLTDALAEQFAVVTYDPLGLTHGRLGLPVADQRVEEWSDGARRVLDAVLADGERAYVLGTSSGGIAALDLLTRHPGRLRHVIAHEPPCVGVLPDGERQLAAFQGVYDTYRTAGPAAAGARLGAVLAERPTEESESPGSGRPLSREEELNSPMAVFLAHVLRGFTAYVPAPGTPPVPLTLAAGTGSRGQLLHRTAVLLAERAQSGFVEFPGGHLGALEHPGEFAASVADVLSLTSDRS